MGLLIGAQGGRGTAEQPWPEHHALVRRKLRSMPAQPARAAGGRPTRDIGRPSPAKAQANSLLFFSKAMQLHDSPLFAEAGLPMVGLVAFVGFASIGSTVRAYLELVRFSHTVFALPFALLAAAMAVHANAADSPPVALRWQELLGIVLCMITARSAAMAFNRIVDRRFDAANPRTAQRHLPRGAISVAAVIGLTVASSAGFAASTLLFLPRNYIPLIAAAPVLLFLFGYSYAKRFTAWSHFWLGAALMLAPLAAWAALRPVFDWSPLLLGGAVMFWVAGFDVIYACQDYEFDRQTGLHSVPVRWGLPGALRIAAGCHLLMLILLGLLPWFYPPLGAVFTVGLIILAGVIAYEHWLVRPDDLTRVNRAFFHVNAIFSVGVFVLGVIDIFW